MTDAVDILVLGATGFTGKLITRYIAAHPQKAHFSLAVGARSATKLQQLVEELNLPASIKLVQVDVAREDELERAISGARVVINCIGPFFHSGPPIVRACVRHGVHYVDITGEAWYIKKIIHEYDYSATKNKVIVVPSCGFDSVPSDTCAFLANKTLKSLPPVNGEYHTIGECTTAWDVKGGLSGGTAATAAMGIAEIHPVTMQMARLPYSLSPVVGIDRQWMKLFYHLDIPGEKPILGGPFLMAMSNNHLVERSFGLLEAQYHSALVSPSQDPSHDRNLKQANLHRFGPKFAYSEFLIFPTYFGALKMAFLLTVGYLLLACKLVRAKTHNFARSFLPTPGTGPSDEEMEEGYFSCTNLAKSTSNPPVQVKTVMKGKGDGGYLLTAMMVTESALCIILPPVSQTKVIVGSVKRDARNSNISSLPPLAQQGGVLTPMTAFGDVLIQRLQETGRFSFSSSVVSNDSKTD